MQYKMFKPTLSLNQQIVTGQSMLTYF